MRRRNAFTIVELLVAMALIMFIMAILSTAFVAATTTFRNLKAIGDMANKLRAVTTLLQRDLAADHFDGKKRLSSPNFWVNGPPSQGFFRIWQGSPPTTLPNGLEGWDLDKIGSYRSVNHMLAFTVKLRGDQMGDFLTAGPQGGGSVLGPIAQIGPAEARYQSPGTYNYQWAEVTWFLQPQTDPYTGVQDTTIGGVPLYTLYRNQRLAVPDNSVVPGPQTNPALFLEVSNWLNPATKSLYFNSPIDLTVPSRRFGMNPASAAGVPVVPGSYPTLAQQGATGTLVNADIQATDVVSFDVRLLVAGSINPGTGAPMPPNFGQLDPFVSLYNGIFSSYQHGNPAFSAATGPRVFDTWSSLSDAYSNYSAWNLPGQLTSIPLWKATTQTGPIILAIQITIRLWDFKTQQTREVTIVQAM